MWPRQTYFELWMSATFEMAHNLLLGIFCGVIHMYGCGLTRCQSDSMLDADQIAHLPCPEIWATIRRIQKLDAPTKSYRSDYRENPGFVREKTPNVYRKIP